ncbi:unnamed protein product [Caenorhabditis bovis]|uniref:Tat-binding homolog 7 n=1 Tax=Caenorhabditis bovis TaxID=2654633 RepID=A0A8S1FDT0_9PELO|nr:unnamed protein product [Caenorhabditis bovis]
MPARGDGLSPHKNLRRSSRDHARLYSSLKENQLGVSDREIERIFGRSSDYRTHSVRYTRSGRKINDNPYYAYDGFSSDDDEVVRRPERRLTYRQQMAAAMEQSAKIATSGMERRNSDSRRRKRVYLDEDDLDEPIPETSEPKEDQIPTRRSTRQRSVQADSAEQEQDKDYKELSSSPTRPRRNTRNRSRIRLESEEPKDENGVKEEAEGELQETSEEPETGEPKNEPETEPPEQPIEEEEEEEEKDEEEEDEEDTEEEEEFQQKRRTYSLRQRRPAVVTFRQEQDRELRERRSVRNQQREERANRRSRRSHRSLGGGSRHRQRSDTDSSGDDGPRYDRKGRIHLDRTRFMPINMSEKELASTSHVLHDRIRKAGCGAGSSDIDPMSLDESVTFEQVGGLSSHIQCLKEMILFPMLYPEIFSTFNINPPKGVIFYGPPGTGKTLVARALANECRKGANKVAFFMRKGADCLSKWVGESERQLRLLFDQAYSMRPSIIFFDEIDGLAPVRSSKQDQIHASIVSTLLALMDGLDSRGEVVVIGATNRLDTIDPALRRPGRFDRELRFSLPDVNARRQILNIHTSKWENNKPSDETIEAITDATSGYCGADLKFLCTEAVLIALRLRYPHIYMSSERLRLNVGTIKVEKEHFMHAMRRITPASRRDLTIPSRPLDERTSILLEDVVNNLISTRIPQGYKTLDSLESSTTTELEKVVRALEPHPTVPAVRLLICGSLAVADGGQTSYVLPAVLSRLDHLPVFSLSVSSLLSDGRPEEAFSHVVQAALRASTTGPCILLIPSIDEWQEVVPVAVQQMLITFLESMTGFTPILFLASLNSSFEDASDYVRDIFRHGNCVAMPSARRTLRERYFEHVTAPAFVPPKVFDASKYEKPDVETDANAPEATRKLSEPEARELEKMYMSLLRQLRIFLRDRLNRLARDRRFADFYAPVKESDAEDYYEIIKNPMCLTDMMDKLDRKAYNHADEFLADIRLITDNALEYNPSDTADGRLIRHMAAGLRDVAIELLDSELDENFVENLENTSRLLQEAGITPEEEKLIEMPRGFVRKAPWSVKNSLKNEIERWAKEREKEAKKNGTTVTTMAPEVGTPVRSHKRKRSKSYNLPGCKKRKTVKHDDNEEDEETGDDEEMEEVEVEVKENTEEVSNSDEPHVSPSATDSPNVVVEKEPELVISKHEIDVLIEKCVNKSEGWSVSELERLAPVMSHKIEQYRNEWDRTSLPSQLMEIVDEWQPRISESVQQAPTKNGIMNGH